MIAPGGPFVFDASAILALILQEAGSAIVQSSLDGGIISAVNAAEVLARLSDAGTPPDEARRAFVALDLDVRSMDFSQAYRSAEIRPSTRSAGLSLGDRVCLALAAELGLPVLTADRQWFKVASAINVAVTLIR